MIAPATAPPPTRAPLLARLDAVGAQVERRIEAFVARLPTDVPDLAEGVAYTLGLDLADRAARGKRLRPALCVLAAEALGGAPDDALPFAIAIELMHNFALVHDDIEDGDRTRRGRPAVWVRHGLAHGINIGDYCLVQVFRALADEPAPSLDPARRLDLVRLMVETLDHTHRGQALDIGARGAATTSLADYDRLVREKTGHYLAAPFVGGALAAGAPRDLVDRLLALGPLLGPLFQIRDDVIDLGADKGREAPGSDIREGKRSFLVAWTLERADARARARLLEVLDAPRDATTPDMVAEVVELFARHGALDAAARRIADLRADVARHAEPMPEALRDLVGDVAHYLATRDR